MEEESKEQKEAAKKRDDSESSKPSHSTPSPQTADSFQPMPQQPSQSQPTQSPPSRSQPQQPREQQQQQAPFTSPPQYYPYSPYPPIPPPSPYYPPQQPPQSFYSWELYPQMGRELGKRKDSRKPILAVISAFLIITFALGIPIAGLMIYYSSSDGVDFGGTTILEGEITAEDGANLSGATISIKGTDLNTTSDAQGNFRIISAPRGIWTVKVSLEGYKEETHKVLIHQDFIESVDFQLEEGSGSRDFNDLWFFLSLAILVMLFSPFIFAGAYYATKRIRFSVVLVGSIMGIITMSPAFVLSIIPSIFIMGTIGFIFSFSALVMTVTNRKAFSKSKVPPSQNQADHPE